MHALNLVVSPHNLLAPAFTCVDEHGVRLLEGTQAEAMIMQ